MIKPSKYNKQLRHQLLNILVIVITIGWLLPIVWMFLNSFRNPTQTFYYGILPEKYTIINYIKLFKDKSILVAFRNSIIVSGSSALIDIILALLAGYGFSRFQFKGKHQLKFLLLIIRLYPGMILAITIFQLAGLLNIYDSLIPIVFLNALINLPFAVWMLQSTLDALPVDLEEAAWIDGISRLQGIFKIILPTITPSIVATFAFIFLLSWNEYLFAVTFIRSPEKQLVTLKIAENIGQYHIDFIGLMATGMLATLPLMIIFIWMQKYIVSGLAEGAVK
ncbi:MAG: carbohydrate ABC transporter permease [Chloroflexi bacterium]|jgi:ABC-type glycerol-3-phosphate transport system permease component|nr:carbohydrate ABC transporter permease [Chloroflexota bacterium]